MEIKCNEGEQWAVEVHDVIHECISNDLGQKCKRRRSTPNINMKPKFGLMN